MLSWALVRSLTVNFKDTLRSACRGYWVFKFAYERLVWKQSLILYSGKIIYLTKTQKSLYASKIRLKSVIPKFNIFGIRILALSHESFDLTIL